MQALANHVSTRKVEGIRRLEVLHLSALVYDRGGFQRDLSPECGQCQCCPLRLNWTPIPSLLPAYIRQPFPVARNAPLDPATFVHVRNRSASDRQGLAERFSKTGFRFGIFASNAPFEMTPRRGAFDPRGLPPSSDVAISRRFSPWSRRTSPTRENSLKG